MLAPQTVHADQQDRHVVVSLRMIGHQLLLNAGDLESRVLPIERVGDRYKIPFESEFSFDPGELVATVDSMIMSAGIADRYLVEVEDCGNQQVVYSYEMGFSRQFDMVPCGGRAQPQGCYQIFLTLWNDEEAEQQLVSPARPGLPAGTWGLMILGVVLFGILLWRRSTKSSEDSPEAADHLVAIGVFQFDPHQLTLTHQEDTTPLTSKEADLLALLHSSVNQTLERDQILKEVWGNENGYVGRTLDVFISKLRKKLAADPNLKIINVRGVGYRLVAGS